METYLEISFLSLQFHRAFSPEGSCIFYRQCVSSQIKEDPFATSAVTSNKDQNECITAPYSTSPHKNILLFDSGEGK